jgi:hypothetical protein
MRGVKRVATIALGLVLWAVPAQASTVIQSPNPIYQKWVDRARVVTPEITIEVVEGPCYTPVPNDGCTAPGMPIYLTPGGDDWQRTFYHELGHQFDYVTGASAAWGWGTERFAEVYAVCATWERVPWGQRVSGLGRKKQAQACQRLR